MPLVRSYASTDPGAPVLNGKPGSMIAVLDATLVNGYNEVSVSSLTSVGATATVVCSTPHGLRTGDFARISGAAQAEYNIDAVVTVVSPTSYTYTVTGAPASPATGTIKSRKAPAGFEKAFSGTNKAAYRATDPSSTRFFYRVDDSGALPGAGIYAYVVGYEGMTDIDTGLRRFPSDTAFANGYVWYKSRTNNSATGIPWEIYSDGKTVYFFSKPMTNEDTNTSGAFGDFVTRKPSDAYNAFITGGQASGNIRSGAFGLYTSHTSVSGVINNVVGTLASSRTYFGLASPVLLKVFATGISSTVGGNSTVPFPNPRDWGIYFSRVFLLHREISSDPTTIYGFLPGMYESYNSSSLADGTSVIAQDMGGRELMAKVGYANNVIGTLFLDITGPWS